MSQKETCYGCINDICNQQGHMFPGGCLYNKSLSFSSESNIIDLEDNNIEHPLGSKQNPIVIN